MVARTGSSYPRSFARLCAARPMLKHILHCTHDLTYKFKLFGVLARGSRVRSDILCNHIHNADSPNECLNTRESHSSCLLENGKFYPVAEGPLTNGQRHSHSGELLMAVTTTTHAEPNRQPQSLPSSGTLFGTNFWSHPQLSLLTLALLSRSRQRPLLGSSKRQCRRVRSKAFQRRPVRRRFCPPVVRLKSSTTHGHTKKGVA